ncbi:nuclear transport factor 2 family protein [Sphingomonas sp. MS122]|uniref:nuclear transport factor 2 family protein n=1 Tax=Sphingomonas sp. MS122 TaxID=3412683 RepID=UPI003C2DA875
MNPETRFRAYLHAFNGRDWNALRGFYAPEVRLMIGNGTELAGREAIIDFYTRVNRQTRRTIEIVQCLANEVTLAAEIESEFLALEDVPDFLKQPLVRGDRYYLNSFVFYEFSGEQYTRIRAATFRSEFRPVASTEEKR